MADVGPWTLSSSEDGRITGSTEMLSKSNEDILGLTKSPSGGQYGVCDGSLQVRYLSMVSYLFAAFGFSKHCEICDL
jgi:hypothetical protein